MSRKDAAFWTGIASKYAAKPVGDMPAYERTLTRVRAWLPANADVLEVGCGTGTTALKLADAARHITAIDYAQGMIDVANAKQVPDNVTFLTADLADPALPDAGYDAVMAFSLLHLLPDLDAGLAQMRAKLRPGGLLIVKAVCLGGLYRPLSALIWVMQRMGKAPYVNIISPRRMEDAIRHAGFEILETGDYPARPPSHFVVARMS